MYFPVLNKRNREFCENQVFWVLLLWRLVAEGKRDAIFLFHHFLSTCTFPEILMSNNSSIAIFPYSYIFCLDGIILDRIVTDIFVISGESIKPIFHWKLATQHK